jgi:hypothetical protein
MAIKKYETVVEENFLIIYQIQYIANQDLIKQYE